MVGNQHHAVKNAWVWIGLFDNCMRCNWKVTVRIPVMPGFCQNNFFCTKLWDTPPLPLHTNLVAYNRRLRFQVRPQASTGRVTYTQTLTISHCICLWKPMVTVWPRWMWGRMLMAMLDHESNTWIKKGDHSQNHQTSCHCCEIPLHRNFVISYWNLVCTRQLKQSNPLSLMKQQYNIFILKLFFLLFLQLGWLA